MIQENRLRSTRNTILPTTPLEPSKATYTNNHPKSVTHSLHLSPPPPPQTPNANSHTPPHMRITHPHCPPKVSQS